MIDYLLGFIGAGFVALAGAGGAVIAMNLPTQSPRLMTAGIASAVIGIVVGGLTLKRR